MVLFRVPDLEDVGRGDRRRQHPLLPNVIYRITSLIRNSALLGLYSRTVPRALWWSWGEGLFRMSERGNPGADHGSAGMPKARPSLEPIEREKS